MGTDDSPWMVDGRSRTRLHTYSGENFLDFRCVAHPSSGGIPFQTPLLSPGRLHGFQPTTHTEIDRGGELLWFYSVSFCWLSRLG